MTKADRAELQRLGVLYESLHDDLKRLIEIVQAQQPAILSIPRLTERVKGLETDVKTLKPVTVETNHDLKKTNQRLDVTNERVDSMHADLKSELMLLRRSVALKFHRHEARLRRLERIV